VKIAYDPQTDTLRKAKIRENNEVGSGRDCGFWWRRLAGSFRNPRNIAGRWQDAQNAVCLGGCL